MKIASQSEPIIVVARGEATALELVGGASRVQYEAGTCAEALQLVELCRPVSLIATPPDLPDGDWRGLLSALTRRGSRASFVVCDGSFDPLTEAAAHEAGAHYVVKNPKLFAYLAAHPEQRRRGRRLPGS